MAQHFIQAKDAVLDALRKPAIQQDLYNDVGIQISNDQLKEKHFTPEEIANFNRVKHFAWQYIRMFENSVVPSVQGLLSNAIVAGGCFTSLLGQGNPKDYDVFILKNDPERDNLLDDLTRHVGVHPERWSMKAPDELNYLQNNHIQAVFTDKFHKVQIMFTNYVTREELIDDFDFIHCRVSMTLGTMDLGGGVKLFISPETYQAIKKKELIINKKSETGAKDWRIQRFRDAGWTVV